MKQFFLGLLLAMTAATTQAQSTSSEPDVEWNTPGAGNPILPGYFADPTIRKFGDTYYIYATTDGTGNGYGPPQVWVSKDFRNWRNVLLNWPTTEVVWAPDVVQQPDGSFRYYYCTPCQVYVGESQSPVGPWVNRLGSPEAVLVPDRFVHNAITLDPALFRDDDGAEYLYFGTWGIYKGFGCGVARLADDGKSFTDKKLILNTEITDFFEAPYVFKRNGVYYFTYSSGSCHDDTYRVQYATSTEGPMGPYTYRGCILKTNADGTIHGPGHHSVLEVDGQYYIVYHRHNNPHAIHGFHRQICIDRMEFDSEGNIKPIVPTHQSIVDGLSTKYKVQSTPKNLAFGAKVTASSTYSDWFKEEYAVDDNNGTLWRAASCRKTGTDDTHEWLQIDLGKAMKFNQVWTQFEYVTFFYQYYIETSLDGQTWTMFADRRQNTQQGSPMIDKHDAKARYVRITITDTQKAGHFPAIWNVKVFNATKRNDPEALLPNPQIDEAALVRGYPWIHKKDVEQPTHAERHANGWMTGISAEGRKVGDRVQGVLVVPKDGVMAFRFTGKERMDFDAPQIVYNSPYTIAAWVLNPDIDGMETICQLNSSRADLATVELRSGLSPTEGIVAHNASMENAGARNAVKPGVWQQWVVSFDGFLERVYCDGQLVSEKNIFLMLRPEGRMTIGQSAHGSNPFTGYIHSLHIYDYALTEAQILTEEGELHRTAQPLAKGVGIGGGRKDAQFGLSVTALSPSLIEVTMTEAEATTNGLIDYQFACGTDSTCLDGAPVVNASGEGIGVARTTLGAAGDKVFVKMRDIYGQELPVRSEKVKVKSNKFRDLFQQHEFQLSSSGSNLQYVVDKAVPMQTVEVTGDFVLECRVTDMTGLKTHNVPGYNEGGILIQVPSADGQTQQVVQLGAFPLYNCGNMVTVVSRRGRPQYQNQKGYRFDPWMQIQRRGNTLTFRTSPDGRTWTEQQVPDTDFSRLLGSGPVRAGIYQTTYSDAEGSVSFSDVHLWQAK